MSTDVAEAVAHVAEDKIPPLEVYTSLPVASDYLHDVTRQRVFQMAMGRVFRTIRSVPGAGVRPAAYVIQNVELLAWRKGRCAECVAEVAAGGLVDYCTHTDLSVPAWQADAWEAWLAEQQAAAASA